MPLNSYEFVLVFLPISVAGFWWLRRHFGRAPALWWLILASVIFYACSNLITLAILLPSIALDFFLARMMLRADVSQARRRSALFVIGVVANIVFLGYFKYKNFLLGTVDTLFGAHFELTPLLLPLGISFLTFQKIAFLADVRADVVRRVPLQEYLLFTLFFPRTLAGPIIHYQEVMPQFEDPKPEVHPSDSVPRVTDEASEATTPRGDFNLARNIAVGIALFSIGLFKKAIVADGVAAFTQYHDRGPITFIFAWIEILAYVFQLYFDFSGYSDMALGAARLFGVRLPMNFNSPLKATSIVEFWSRWHITLTRFLTAYIYTPMVLSLTRSRMEKGRPVLKGKRSSLSAILMLVGLPTLTTMAVSGLWHGAGWQFVLWGLLHGFYLTLNQAWRILRPRFWKDQHSYNRAMGPLGFVLTFGAVVLSLVFFRADSIQSAFSTLAAMVGLHGLLPHYVVILRDLGLNFDWAAIWHPFAPFRWLVALFLAVVLLPNSLELLRRFQPALDFPEISGTDDSITKVPSTTAIVSRSRLLRAVGKARYSWEGIGARGLALNRLTAWMIALLSVLGLMGLNHAGKFMYGQF